MSTALKSVADVEPVSVVVHPIVLLSVVDHYNRVAKDTNRRVVGTLLGERSKDGTVDVSNCYAVPFEEESRTSSVFYLDHHFHEDMFHMFNRVQAKEQVVGWYHTGPKIGEADLKINEIFARYVKDPVMVIIDVKPKDEALPLESFYSVEEIKADGSSSRRTFRHLATSVGAVEAEEVGVEHLLRDIKNATISRLSEEIAAKLTALRGLRDRLEGMATYIDDVLNRRIPVNHDIVSQIQDVFNLLPNLTEAELIKAFAVKTNDMMAVIYLASMIRSVVALHSLINNKLRNKAIENGTLEVDPSTTKEKEDAIKEKDKDKAADKAADKGKAEATPEDTKKKSSK